MEVKPKKHLGQHFLKDLDIAKKIADSLLLKTLKVIEIGPGMGVLTQFLKQVDGRELFVSEIDQESVEYLLVNEIIDKEHLLGDFLQLDLNLYFTDEIAVIGNFPYNISSQIVFKAIENRALIPEFAGMFQKEVAERIAAKPGNKQYGIISVFTQAYFDVEYLFTVEAHVFSPPPKVQSGVIRLVRKPILELGCDELLFRQIVKNTFGTRRKMLRVSLKRLIGKNPILEDVFFQKRPEELSFEEFVILTNQISALPKDSIIDE